MNFSQNYLQDKASLFVGDQLQPRMNLIVKL